MAIVRFPEYRQYDAARIDASNAMMGLLVGAQLAAHLLQLTDGSRLFLPDIYPNVEHINRVNLTSTGASNILRSADQHLGRMAVPHALAIHEDHLRTCLRLLATAGRAPVAAANAKLFSLHQKFETATGGSLPSDSLEQFHMIRHMRNSSIHSGGLVDSEVIKAAMSMSANAEASWVKITGSSPKSLKLGDVLPLGQSEMILTLAVTKRITTEMNHLLVPAIPQPQWADIAISDLAIAPGIPRASQERLKRARGFAKHYYGACNLTDHQLGDALTRAGAPPS